MNEPRSVEISAMTVDEAVDLALDQLDADEDEVRIEVLREPGEPDEHGYPSDEALVLVTLLAAAPVGADAPPTRAEETAPPPRAPRARSGSRPPMEPGERLRVAEVGQEALSDLLHHLGLVASCRANPASVNNSDAEEPVTFEIEGEDLGMLIGRRGENLDALQLILNLMVQKWVTGWPNIAVDVAGYRKRRQETLEQLARRMARRVAETQQPYTFDPMHPRERRIVHVSIGEDARVRTESLGEGDERRVVIYPAE